MPTGEGHAAKLAFGARGFDAFIQGGCKFLRDARYMPALAAVRFNPDMTAKYQDLRARGKPKKVVLTAIMRKLIELANTLVKDGRKWSPKPA